MKFDVVISNPPFRVATKGWEKHTAKHLYLLDDEAYYALVCPADHITNEAIKARCQRFNTLKVQKVEHFSELIFLDNVDVYYYIWKK